MKSRVVTLLLSLIASAAIAQQINELDASRAVPDTPAPIAMAGQYGDVSLSVNSRHFQKNGKPWFPLMGEIHYNRVRPDDWETEIRKMKSAGLTVIATYIFWNEHETAPGVWDWHHGRDLRRFISLCRKNGLYVWLRIGPWCHGEQRHGGFPDWIQALKGHRTNNPAYLAEVRKLFGQIGGQSAGMYFAEGGPVIGVQLENEYASGQAEHVSELKKMALAAGITPVYWTVTANTVFDDTRMDVIPLQGSYPYRGWERAGGGPTKDFLYGNDQWIMSDALGKVFYDVTRFPKGLCEQGCGSQMTYPNRFRVEPHVVEAHLQNQIGRGMNLVGYYMFHGGTQTPGLQEEGMYLSYDFQSPIGESGQLRPSYRSLKRLHAFVNDFGDELVDMQVAEPENPVRNERDTTRLRYIARVKGDAGFLFLGNTQVRLPMPDRTVALRVKLPQETIAFPSFVLKGQTTPILPFNLRLDNVRIRYATAQPLARIPDGNGLMVFFQKLEGVVPELALGQESIKAVDAPGWKVRRTATGWQLNAASGGPVTVTKTDHRRVTLLFLDRKEAENAWRTRVGGREVLLLTNADVIQGDNGLELTQLTDPRFSMRVYPSGLNAIANAPAMRSGVFDAYEIAVNPVSPDVAVTQPQPDRALVTPVAAWPESLNDVFLQISYLGGSAKLYRDGRWITDDLLNGTPWELSLKRFGNGTPLTLQAEPWQATITGVPEELQKQLLTGNTRFTAIRVVPQYRAVFRPR